MRRRSGLVVGALVLTLSLAGCASGANPGGAEVPGGVSAPSETSEPMPTPSQSTDAAARAQAQAWLDAASLPPGAVRSEVGPDEFASSYTGWPCGPVEELEAFWTIPGATVIDTANWMMTHPTADLVTTALPQAFENPAIDSALVGYIPEPDSQEGVVYTIMRTEEGVAVRAEIAAQTESATCPPLPNGGTYGPPGQG